MVPSALKPPKFQQKLFLSIVLSLLRLPALGAPYTITTSPARADPTRWPRGPARGPSAPLCGVGTTSRAAPRAPPAPGVWVARGPWCHRGSCALLGCCESPRDPCQQPGGFLRVGAVQGEQVPYPKGEQKRCDGGQCSRAFNVEQEG